MSYRRALLASSSSADSAGTRPADPLRPPAAARAGRSRRRAWALLLAGGHLFVLSAFAFAQPLFDLIARNAEFFAVRGSTREDVVAFVLGALLIPPAVLLLVELVATAAGVLVWRAVHVLFVAALSAVVVLQALAQRVDGGVLLIAAAAALGAAVAWLYVRTPLVRTFFTVLIPAPVILAAALPLRLAGAQAAHGRGGCARRGCKGLEDARPGGRDRLRRAHDGLAPERPRPDRRRAVPELRPARARRDLLPPGDDRSRLDRARGSGDPDRTHPAGRRAADLRRPPGESLHAARADVPDPRPRVDHEPLPEGALPPRKGGAGRGRAALLAGPGRPGGGGLVRVGRLDPLPAHAAAVLACRAPAGGRPVVAELPRRRGHGDQDGERRRAGGRAALRAGLPADARPRVGARGDALLLPRADPAPTLALPPVGQDATSATRSRFRGS